MASRVALSSATGVVGGGRRGMMGIVVHHVEAVGAAGDTNRGVGVLSRPRFKLGTVVGRVEVPVLSMSGRLVEALRGGDQADGEELKPELRGERGGVSE